LQDVLNSIDFTCGDELLPDNPVYKVLKDKICCVDSENYVTIHLKQIGIIKTQMWFVLLVMLLYPKKTFFVSRSKTKRV